MFRSAVKKTLTKRMALLLTLAGSMLLPIAAMAGSNIPSVVITGPTTVPATGLGYYQANIALDSCGNIYSIQSGSVYSAPGGAVAGGLVVEIPAGGGAATTILAAGGPNYDSNALFMDATKSNLYVTEGPYNVYKIPITNCVPQTGSKTSFGIGNLGPVSYYWSGGAVAADSAGNVFIGTNADCCGSGNELVEENATDTTGTTLLTNIKNNITSIALDKSNNLYFVQGGGLYELPYNSTSLSYAAAAVSFGSGYSSNVVGVATDAAGNLYVSDAGASGTTSAIYEIPNETSGSTSALNPADQFAVATGITISGPVALDPSGNIYYTNENYTGTVTYPGSLNYIYELTRQNAVFASSAVGTSASTTLNVLFNAAETPASISIAGPKGVFTGAAGGTCAAKAYAAGDSCTVNVTFAPVTPGVATGAVVLADSTGAPIATANLSGLGSGAAFTADPGSAKAIGSGFINPSSVAHDSTGNIFIADPGANTVWELAAGTTAPVAVGSGFSKPTGVAVDGAGNVYVADTGNSRVSEIPVVSAALSATAQFDIVPAGTAIAGSALASPAGVGTDAAGNLYIADTGNNRVVFLPHGQPGDLVNAHTLGSGLSSPLATAVANNGTIYIADTGNGRIVSLPTPDGFAAANPIVTGLDKPSALAVDPAGDLFVVESGNSVALRIPNLSGTLTPASEKNITDGILNPYGLALDASGNLVVTDDVNAATYSIARAAVTLTFGQTTPKTTSNPITLEVESSGNMPLVLGTPAFAATGNTNAFEIGTMAAGACAAAASIPAGSACTIQATFAPPDYANYSEVLAFATNATNAATTQVTLSGTGGATLATNTTIQVVSPTGNPYYGQAIQIATTVTAATGTPGGIVALLVDGAQAASATLSSSGTATLSLPTGLTGGKHTLQVSFEGAQVGFIYYSQSQSPISTVEVTRVTSATALTIQTANINPISQPAGKAVPLLAVVSSTYAGIPTGTVTFTVHDPAAGTAPVLIVIPAGVSNGIVQATTSYTPIAPVSGAFDTVTVSATYNGDINFEGSISALTAFAVAPATGSVVLGQIGGALTSSASSQTGVTFTTTSYGGWTGVVGYQCDASTLPANAICLFSPGQLNVLASTPTANYPAATTKLTVIINNPPNSPAQSSIFWLFGGLFSLGFLVKRRKLARAGLWKAVGVIFVLSAFLAALSAVSGCSSGLSFRTPTGSSTVKVIASADPYVAGSTTNIQTCTSAAGVTGPTEGPCTQQTFEVPLTVQ